MGRKFGEWLLSWILILFLNLTSISIFVISISISTSKSISMRMEKHEKKTNKFASETSKALSSLTLYAFQASFARSMNQ